MLSLIAMIIVTSLLFVGQLRGEPSLQTLVSGLNGPYAIAVNKQGNILFTDAIGGISEIPTNTTQVQKIISYSEPALLGAAFDLEDNFWYSAYYSGNISEIPPGENISLFFTALPPQGPTGLAIDKSGNLYVSTFNDNEILKIGVDRTERILARGENPYLIGGVAVDSQSNVYFQFAGGIYFIPKTENKTYSFVNDNAATVVTIDEVDVLYYVDFLNGATPTISIMRQQPGSNSPEKILTTPSSRPAGIAVRGGVMYLTFEATGSIGKIILPPLSLFRSGIPLFLFEVAAADIALVLTAVVYWKRKKARRLVARSQSQLTR